MLFANALLHFCVDGICAFAMFGRFEAQIFTFLLYNLCAFALQMPIGGLVDLLAKRIRETNETHGDRMVARFYFLITLAGLLVTLIGAFVHPVLLGIGNALFHVGGGVATILSEKLHRSRGWRLGVFVAPGAMGLFVGKLLAGSVLPGMGLNYGWLMLTWGMIMLVGAAVLYSGLKKESVPQKPSKMEKMGDSIGLTETVITAGVCFLVVFIRSYVGLGVSFPWAEGALCGFFCTGAVVLGKMAGGFLAARVGELKTIGITLSLATIGFAFFDVMWVGISALFFFNMTMPITLNLLIRKCPQMPGFSFGLLTFALFVGFFLIALGMVPSVSAQWLGAIGSIVSMGLLLVVVLGNRKKTAKQEKKGA